MPCGIRPDVISTRPVSVSTTNVSTYRRIATAPWSCGRFDFGQRVGVGVEAKDRLVGEQAAGQRRKRMDCCTVTPAMPPAMACGSNASTNTCASAPGSALALMTRMTMQPSAENAAMIGTTFFRYSGNSLHAAQEDERRNGRHHDAHRQPVQAKGVVERITDGVGLHHVAQ